MKFAHQMNHKDHDSGSGHIPTKQWTNTIDSFYVSHEQVFRLQGFFLWTKLNPLIERLQGLLSISNQLMTNLDS